ncbi:MAG: RNA polymerase factor sigma-32 [Pseudomonadota bacterium]
MARKKKKNEILSAKASNAKDTSVSEGIDAAKELSDEILEPEIEAEILPPAHSPTEASAIAEILVEDNLNVEDLSSSEKIALIPSERSLAVIDPLQAYMNEARRYPLLTPEQEYELAIRYTEKGDLEAAKQLITANLRLVVKIAHEYRRAYQNLLDLVQEGNIGLMQAVKKFDPYRGVKLSSYASWWIRAYILRFILNNWRLVKIGTTHAQRKLFFNLRKEVEHLERMGIESPGPKLLAQNLSVPEHEVRTMQVRLAARDVSLDAPISNKEGSPTSRMDLMAHGDPNPEKAFEDKEFSAIIHEKVVEFGKTLHGRDKEIFELRTVAEEPLTLQEIGTRYGITRERARQLENRLMNHLRDYLKQEIGDAVNIVLGKESDQ